MSNSFEKTASKTMGAVKVAKAGLKGLSGVFRKLMQEHGEAGALIKHVSMSADEDVRRELYPQIRRALLAHEKGELSVVYPVLSEHEETRAIAAEHAHEASELESVIRALDKLDFSASTWASTFERLASLVDRHVAEEEGNFFPKAQQTIGELKAKALESRYETAKQAALNNID